MGIASIDPALSLALAMHSNRGVYAVLIGSGVSRAASIPTGWEIVGDLIRRLGVAKGDNCDPDPHAWYQDKFGVAPDYSDVLSKLARRPAERQQLLPSYTHVPVQRDGASPPVCVAWYQTLPDEMRASARQAHGAAARPS
ncbi:MAG TPA: hypothetical protein VK550_16375 [Polyangiaceae bacterium]|nr:hypothetical protein [Polyangiaceae bacterium]